MRKLPVLLFSLLLIVGLAVPALAQDNTLNLAGEPNFGTASLSSGFLPDPFIVSVVSGGGVDVSSLNLGSGCTGYATSAPDYRLQWEGGSSQLRIFFVSDGDTTLIVNRADGQWACNDDSHSTLNPTVDIANAPSGQYDIWVGSFSSEDLVPGYLMITEVDSYPGHIISPILGEVVNPLEGGTPSTTGGALDIGLPPNFGTGSLAPGFVPDPHTVSVLSGGSVDVSTLNLGADCRGFATSAPDYRLILSGSSTRLRIFFVGNGDTTLIVNTASAQWLCNDDSSGTLNPMIEITNAPGGQYDIWVGSFGTGTAVSGTLYITELDFTPANAPAA